MWRVARPAETDYGGSYRQLVELSPAAIIVQSGEQIIYANRTSLALFGIEQPQDLIGTSIWDRASSGGAPLVEQYRQVLREGLSLPPAEFDFVRPNGSHFRAELSARPMLFDGTPSFQVVLREIAKLQPAEADLKQRNRELAALYAIAATVSLSTDLDQILKDALAEVIRLKIVAGEMFGMLFLLDESSQRLRLVAAQGAPPDHPCLATPPAIGECLCGLAVQRGEMIVSQDALADERHTRRWMEGRNHQDICIPLNARGNILGVMEIRLPQPCEIAVQDLQLLQAVADQIAIAAENAMLLKRRERDVVEERERIARELHDEFSQLLGYVTTKAMAVRLLLKNGRLKAADRNLLQLEKAARSLYVDVRELIMGLRMVGRKNVGFVGNLRELCAYFTQLSGLPVDLAIGPQLATLPLKLETEYNLLRIVQEALNNTRKHASPKRTWVSANVQGGRLELHIGDDGVGFESADEPEAPSLHFGLRSMHERAAAIGADLHVESSPGRGTLIIVQLPLEKD